MGAIFYGRGMVAYGRATRYKPERQQSPDQSETDKSERVQASS